MDSTIDAPVLFFAPFVSSTMRVEAGWIDFNGHLNMAYYNVLFDRAADEAFGLVGLGPTYMEARGCSFFLAETHVLYKRELTADTPVRITVHLLDYDDKRVHFYMEMRHAREGWLSATSENLSLHVDMTTRKTAPFPPDLIASLAMMKSAHARLPQPEHAGRRVAMRQGYRAELRERQTAH